MKLPFATPSPRLDLWQEVCVGQRVAAECFVVSTPATDPDVLFLIADGYIDVSPHGYGRSVRRVMKGLAFLGRPLLAELTINLLDIGPSVNVPAEDTVRVYCHQALSEPDGKSITLLCSLYVDHGRASRVPEPVLNAAVERTSQHRAQLAKIAADKAAREVSDQIRLEQAPPEKRTEEQRVIELSANFPTHHPHSPDACELLPLFLPGLAVRVAGKDDAAAAATISREIRRSPDPLNPSPRDGWYDALVATLNPKRITAVVMWAPHRGLPPYPEVRAAAERRLPGAFRSPRLTEVSRPEFNATVVAGSGEEIHTAGPFDPNDLGWADALDDEFSLAFDSPEDTSHAIKGRLQKLGFDAIGWYQPHHIHSEESWGIYIDSVRLDEIACSIAHDLRRERFGSRCDSLAAKLAFMLVYQHELFHAKVEAAHTWLELQALRPIFRPYQSRVYVPLRETEGSLEEALANFWAWSWVSVDSTMSHFTGSISADQRAAIDRVMQAHLDLSPPGYRRWREGRTKDIWRVLATQMVQGRPKLVNPGIGLPIEPLLRDKPPFEFIEAEDVPLRFIGAGRIASRILSARSTLRWPSRAELRKVITRHFKYDLVPGQGKGSHEKFRSAGGRMFPLPQRDPVSNQVFNAFLSHFGLNRSEYIKVRQML